jgi:hypothetical protein
MVLVRAAWELQGDMMNRKLPILVFLIAFALAPAAAHAQQAWSGVIDPTRATAWTNAGATVASRSTICSTLGTAGQAASFPQTVTVAQINSAISACPSGQVVFLNAGTYALVGQINFSRSNVTLRGAGPDQTKIVPTLGGGCGNTTSVICLSADSNWSDGPDHLTNWTAGYAQGTTVITLASVSGLSVGQVLILDQLDDGSDSGNIYICGTLAANCSSEGQVGGGGRGGNRAQLQYALVKAINGTSVTISPGLYMPNWTSAKSPTAWWATTLVQNVGIEDLLIDNRVAGTGSVTVFNNAYNCWFKNIASIGGGSRSHVDLQYSPNITVRDSYFWGANGANLSYGIEPWMGGNELVENNIFQHVTTPLLVGAESGSVYAYNYAIDQFTNSATWMYPSAMNHDPGTLMDLFEGNVMPAMMQDTIHGSHAMETYFRNHLSGLDTANLQTQQTVPLILQSFSRYTNFVGNVLGTAGYHNNYQANFGGSSSNCNTSIYNLGWGGVLCAVSTVNNDSVVASTLMRWGNYDVVNGSAQWNPAEVPSGLSIYANAVPLNRTLPTSFYLPGRPSFWPSSKPFPGIGPDVVGGNVPNTGGHAYTIPAEDCYKNVMAGSITSEVGVLTFNAKNCYGQSVSTIAPPTNLTVVSVN